jgi:hypothetical protein
LLDIGSLIAKALFMDWMWYGLGLRMLPELREDPGQLYNSERSSGYKEATRLTGWCGSCCRMIMSNFSVPVQNGACDNDNRESKNVVVSQRLHVWSESSTLALVGQNSQSSQHLLLPLNLVFQAFDLFLLLVNTPVHICQASQVSQCFSYPAFEELCCYSSIFVV